MRKLAVLFLALALTVGLVACKDTSKDSGATSTPSNTTPSSTTPSATTTVGQPTGIPKPAVAGQPTVTSSGLQIYDIVVGSGQEAKTTDTATANYTGWLEDGTMFSTSIGGSPLQFSLAAGQPNSVIPGWGQGVAGMKVGGKRRLIIPADLAYGAQGRGTTIPPNAILTFDIELVSIP